MHGLLFNALLEAPLLLAQVEMNEDDNPVWEGWGSVIFVIGLASLIVVLVIGALWFIRGIAIARADAARDEAYQKLAEQSAAIQQQALEEQKRVADELTGLRTRVDNIERILKEVE